MSIDGSAHQHSTLQKQHLSELTKGWNIHPNLRWKRVYCLKRVHVFGVIIDFALENPGRRVGFSSSNFLCLGVLQFFAEANDMFVL
jgi:hypothetical protein